MIIRIDLEAERPLYLQIADGVRRALVDGSARPGDRLPAGRELAASLGVNLETVQRAYRRLAEDGLVTSRVGRGTRVVESVDIDELGIGPLVDELVSAAARLDIHPSRVIALVQHGFAVSESDRHQRAR